MSNYNYLTNQYEKLTNKKGWSTTLFIKLCNNEHNIGIFLDRLVWWSDKGSRPDGYFWKTTEDWTDELGFSYAQVKHARTKLEDLGYIKTKLKKANGAPTIHYWINIELLEQEIAARFGQLEDSQSNGYTKFENVEIQESAISEKSQVEIEESSTSLEIEESQQSITGLSNDISNKEAGDTSPPLRHKMPDVVLAYQIHVEETGSHCLTKKQINIIKEVIGTDPPKLEKWRAVCRAWAMQANKPNNLTGLLDWFNTGIPDYAKGGHQQNGQNDSTTPKYIPPGFEDPERSRAYEQVRAQDRGRT